MYNKIHKTFIKDKDPELISPSAFRDPNVTGISTEWNKYSTPQETQKRPVNHPPEEYGVVSLKVKEIREKEELDKLIIEPSPKQKTKNYTGNRAHTNINGLLEYGFLMREAQVFLSRIVKWEINEKIDLI